MKKSRFNPETRRFVWIVSALTGVLVLVGIVTWGIGLYRFSELQGRADAEATALASGKPRNNLSADEMEQYYQRGLESYQKQAYAPAVDSLKPVVATSGAFKQATAILVLSYKALGDEQAANVAELNKAPQSYSNALDLTQKLRPELSKQFQENPKLVPEGLGSVDNLLKYLEQHRDWSARYSKAQSGNLSQPGGWDSAITELETIFKENPEYLRGNAALWVGSRLIDTYEAKATYLCRVKSSYSEAMAAANRAYEIGFKSKATAEQQRNLQYLVNFVNQTQCQEG